MPVNYRQIARSAPTSTSATDVYTVPAATEIIVSNIFVTALDTSRPTITIDVRPNNTAAANDTKLVKDAVITPGKAHPFGRGLTLDASDVITLTCSAGNKVALQIYGTVIS